MSAISLKSITGITSITTPAGVDNQLTLHTNNTTERVKIDVAGNVHINNQLAVAGVSTFTGDIDVDGHTNLDNVSIAGVTTITGSGSSVLFLESSNPMIRLTDTDNSAYSSIGGESGHLYFYTNSSSRDVIFRGSQEVARITGDGKLGIGTVNPTAPIHLHKASGDAIQKIESSNGAGVLELRHTNGYGYINYLQDGAETFRVGQIAQFTSYSVYNPNSSLPYQFCVEGNGEVGINTHNPANTLHLLRNTNHGITLQKGGTNPGSALIQVSSYGALSLQASNNLTLQSGGSQQIFFNRGSTAVAKFDTSGRLLLGTTTEGHSSADDLTINNSGHGGITIRTGTTSNGAIFFSDATSGAAEYDGFVQYNHDNTNGRLLLGTMGSTTCTVNGQYQSFLVGTTLHRTAEFSHPDGFSIRGDDKGQFQNTVTDVMGGLMNRDGSDGAILGFRREGTSVGHIGVNASTMYLNFGGTNAAAHQLDDYEEGTFTPTFVQGYNSLSYNANSGFYTKIGNHVSYSIYFYVLSGGGQNAEIRISLPFTTKNQQHQEEGAYIVYDSNFLSSSNDSISNCYIMSGRNYSYLRLFKCSNGASIKGNETLLGTGANNVYLLIKGFLTTA